MSLTNLAQIKGGLQLKQDIAALKKSYDAAKVLTQIVKIKAGEGVEAQNYNVEELLELLKQRIDAIAGTGNEEDGASLASLAIAVSELKNKEIADYVRVEFNVANGATALSKEGVAGLLPTAKSIDYSKAFPVYTKDNEVVLNEKGEPLTLDMSGDAPRFNGVPSVIDAEASAASETGEKVYKPLENFDAKIFVIGTFQFSDLPEQFLLDNNEMRLIAYKTAINTLVVELAKDKALIEDIKAKVGTEAIKDQLDAAIAKTREELEAMINETYTLAETNEGNISKLEKRVDAVEADIKKTNGAVDVVKARVAALEGAVEEEVVDKIGIASDATAVTSFKLSKKPSKKLVRAIINHLVYHENEDFTVSRDSMTATWMNTAAAGGFDIDAELTDAVRFEYSVSAEVEVPAEEPTNGGGDTPSTNPAGNDNEPAKKLWSVQFTVPANEAGYNLKNAGLTEEQLADITDLAAAGPNEDGQGRTLELYFVGCGEKKLSEPKPMKWLDGVLAKDDQEFVDAVLAEGFKSYECSTGTYFLASGPDFQVITHADPLTFELAKLDKPYYDK